MVCLRMELSASVMTMRVRKSKHYAAPRGHDLLYEAFAVEAPKLGHLVMGGGYKADGRKKENGCQNGCCA